MSTFLQNLTTREWIFGVICLFLFFRLMSWNFRMSIFTWKLKFFQSTLKEFGGMFFPGANQGKNASKSNENYSNPTSNKSNQGLLPTLCFFVCLMFGLFVIPTYYQNTTQEDNEPGSIKTIKASMYPDYNIEEGFDNDEPLINVSPRQRALDQKRKNDAKRNNRKKKEVSPYQESSASMDEAQESNDPEIVYSIQISASSIQRFIDSRVDEITPYCGSNTIYLYFEPESDLKKIMVGYFTDKLDAENFRKDLVQFLGDSRIFVKTLKSSELDHLRPQ